MIRFFLFLIKIQWRDRIATSAFLIGITLQNALMSFSIWRTSTSPQQAELFGVRAALFSTIGIALFSAMSSIQNEFRYGTTESILLSRFSFFKLVALRALFTTIVSSPAILLPLFVVLVKFPNAFSLHLIVSLLSVYFTLTVVGYQTSFILNSFEVPSSALPWLKNFLLICGLALLPFKEMDRISLILPIGWCLKIAASPENWLTPFFGLLLNSTLSTLMIYFALKGHITKQIERNLISGRTGA